MEARRVRGIILAVAAVTALVAATIGVVVISRDAGIKKSESVAACEAALRGIIGDAYRRADGLGVGDAAERAQGVGVSDVDVRETIISEDLRIAIASDHRRDSDVDTVWEMSATITVPLPLPKNSDYGPSNSGGCVMTVYRDGTISVSNQQISPPVGWSTPYTP